MATGRVVVVNWHGGDSLADDQEGHGGSDYEAHAARHVELLEPFGGYGKYKG